jgi:hypothetical protein
VSSVLAGIGGLKVDLANGFRSQRSPEYLDLHGLPASAANETHEQWVGRIHPEEGWCNATKVSLKSDMLACNSLPPSTLHVDSSLERSNQAFRLQVASLARTTFLNSMDGVRANSRAVPAAERKITSIRADFLVAVAVCRNRSPQVQFPV